MRKEIVVIFLLAIIIIFVGGAVSAQTINIVNPLVATNFSQLLERLIDFLWTMSLILLPLSFMIAALYFTTGGGNEKQIATAKNIFLYAFIGFIVITAARGLVKAIIDILT